MLQNIIIKDYKTQSGKVIEIPLSYHIFGKELHTAPIVMVNHALTDNSDVAGEKGWWKSLIGKQKSIDTDEFTIISSNKIFNTLPIVEYK